VALTMGVLVRILPQGPRLQPSSTPPHPGHVIPARPASSILSTLYLTVPKVQIQFTARLIKHPSQLVPSPFCWDPRHFRRNRQANITEARQQRRRGWRQDGRRIGSGTHSTLVRPPLFTSLPPLVRLPVVWNLFGLPSRLL